MSSSMRFAAFLVVLAFGFGLTGCGKTGGMWDKYQSKKRKGQSRIAYYEIHQPNIYYPNDDVIIWKDPGRGQRAFLLPPGTKVDVVETVDGDKYGTEHVVYKIKTADGREGWVPKKWCRQVYK